MTLVKRPAVVLIAGITCWVPGLASAQGWGAGLPPLSPEDVTLLGEAADKAEKELSGGGDGTVSWNNPETGTFGTVEALESSERDGRPCRNYRLFINAETFEPFHYTPTMCKVDGKWKFVTRNE